MRLIPSGRLGRRALPARRCARLGATPKFHHGLLGVALCAYALAGAFSLTGQARQLRSITDGVYSAGQAARGQQMYQAQCAACHGNAMEGTVGTPLAGDGFLSNWSARPLANLVDKIQKTMPFNLPGSLSRPQSMDLAAFVLESNKFPAGQADVTFVGVGTVDETAALLRDGFVRADELRALVKAGAVGEITGWSYDAQGVLIDGLTNDRVLSVPLPVRPKRKVIAVAMSPARFKGIKGALTGKLVNGLISNETMAEQLLN